MVTFQTRQIRRFVAGLMVAMAAGNLPADDEGVVRLGSARPQEQLVIRGQSPNPLPTMPVSRPVQRVNCSQAQSCTSTGCAPSMSCSPSMSCAPSGGCTSNACGPSNGSCSSGSYGPCGCGTSSGNSCRSSCRVSSSERNIPCEKSWNPFGGGGGHRRCHCRRLRRVPASCTNGYCSHNCVAYWLGGQSEHYRARNRCSSNRLHVNLQEDCREKAACARCKLGYFIPTGSGGKGSPPFGCYSYVYPVTPNHSDARDGQVYAAEGYGGPVSIPLAPNVNHTYNYGWGIPSSRLTPISHPVE